MACFRFRSPQRPRVLGNCRPTHWTLPHLARTELAECKEAIFQLSVWTNYMKSLIASLLPGLRGLSVCFLAGLSLLFFCALLFSEGMGLTVWFKALQRFCHRSHYLSVMDQRVQGHHICTHGCFTDCFWGKCVPLWGLSEIYVPSHWWNS